MPLTIHCAHTRRVGYPTRYHAGGCEREGGEGEGEEEKEKKEEKEETKEKEEEGEGGARGE